MNEALHVFFDPVVFIVLSNALAAPVTTAATTDQRASPHERLNSFGCGE